MRTPGVLLAASLLACAGSPSPKQREAAEIHTNLGLENLRNGRPQDALKEFDEALSNDEGLAEPHLGRGLVLELAFGRLDEAEKEYRRAIALRPDLSEAHNDLGQLLARRGRFDQALVSFDTALSNMHYREPWVARCNKGQALYDLGRRDEGLAELRACLTQSPRYCMGHRALGTLLLQSGRGKEALASLQRYTQVCEKEPDAHYQLGLAHLKLGNAEGAREAFARCEELAGPSDIGTECRRSRDLLR
jgi:type IV pilus assembly protein PilF